MRLFDKFCPPRYVFNWDDIFWGDVSTHFLILSSKDKEYKGVSFNWVLCVLQSGWAKFIETSLFHQN